jgi:glutamate-1-semialdehyde 2,1-aminomutase
MQAFVITEKEIKEARDWDHHDAELYEKIMSNLRQLGVWAEDDAREPWFLCEAHTEAIIDETLNKFEDAVKMAMQ